MAKIKERELAIEYRRSGLSIGDIAARLCVSKSTVSGWCRDIPLSVQAIERIAKASKTKSTEALLRYAENQRSARQQAIETDKKAGANALGELNDRDVYCIGLGLYWGEGYKTGSQEFGFTNSDPAVIKFYLEWLRKVFSIERDQLICRVSINETHAKRITVVEQYWSDVTGVPLSCFTKSSLIKTASKKIYKNKDDHMGTLRIKVRKGTSMRRQVLGAIDAVKKWI